MRNRLFMTGLAILAAVALTMLSGCASMSNKSVAVPLGEWIPVQEAGLEEPLETADQMPVFGDGGGLSEFRYYVMKNFVYPEEALQCNIMGMVKTEFVVEKDGWIKEVNVVESPSEVLSDELTRVLVMSPRWQPGMHEGKPVRVKHTLGVVLNIKSN